MHPSIDKIIRRSGKDDLLQFLATELSDSELNSLLMEVFRQKASSVSPSKLLRDFRENRFAKAVNLDAAKFLGAEYESLKIMQRNGFDLRLYGPVAPFGTSAAFGKVSQHKVLSALRRVEVVADITNVMCLDVADQLTQKKTAQKNLAQKTHSPKADKSEIHLATSHRHVRTQALADPSHTAHFQIAAMTSDGQDRGDFHFELSAVARHIETYLKILALHDPAAKINLALAFASDFTRADEVRTFLAQKFPTLLQEPADNCQNGYYKSFRFGLRHEKMESPIVDGGDVDWVERLSQNKKRRTVTSGIGTELLQKII